MRALLLAVFVSACTSQMGGSPDQCPVKPLAAEGTVELGVGFTFTPVVDGQTVDAVVGVQGLTMVVLNARAQDMDLGIGSNAGYTSAFVLENGQAVAVTESCQVTDYEPASDGSDGVQLVTPLRMPLLPAYLATLDGATVTLSLEIVDQDGRHASDMHTVTLQLPSDQAQSTRPSQPTTAY